MNLKKYQGLTLTEIILVAFLSSMFLGAILGVLALARTSWKSGESQLSVQQEARRSLQEIITALRQARLATLTGVPPDGNTYSSVTFQIPASITDTGTTWSTDIQYSLGGLNNAQILRTQDGNQRIAANNILSLSFRRTVMIPNVMNVSITAQKNTFPGFSTIQSNITLNTDVMVRN